MLSFLVAKHVLDSQAKDGSTTIRGGGGGVNNHATNKHLPFLVINLGVRIKKKLLDLLAVITIIMS